MNANNNGDCDDSAMLMKMQIIYANLALDQLYIYLHFRSTLCSVMAQLTEETQPTIESTLKSKAVSEDANVKFNCVVSGIPLKQANVLYCVMEH